MYGHKGVAGLASSAPLATLPFTGFNVMWMVLAAMTLLTTGIAIRRLVRR
jgi:hypothetical protein